MRPLLRKGDIVEVAEESIYNPGDIVLYRIGKERFIHRVASSEEHRAAIIDDTFLTESHRVNLDQIEGRVIGLVSYNVRKTLFLYFSHGERGLRYCTIVRSVFRIGRMIKKDFLKM